ncbi:MAG: hypothetical protein D8M56_19840 [Chloroflexi bacterium]|nr:hypothetical protein [Chloroflexota bacterium]
MAKKFDWSAPLYCNPHIAVAVGAEAGIVYERLRWMIQDSTSKKKEFGSIRKDGRRWVDFTYAQLYEYLPIFKSVKALRDVMSKLEKAGLIDSETFGSGKWYTISDLDPASLTKIVTETDEICQGDDENRQSRLTKNDTPADENRHSPIDIDTESTSESDSEAVSDSFSSPTPPAVAGEEEEIKTSTPVLNLEQRLLDAFAKLVGVYAGSPEKTKAKLAGGLRVILAKFPDIQPSHFRRFNEYHREENLHRKSGRLYPVPSIDYVVGGWGLFVGWWESRGEEPRYEGIPGTENYLTMSMREWDELSDMESGAMIQIRGQWVYRKQADGTFAEVPREQWPEWARESA